MPDARIAQADALLRSGNPARAVPLLSAVLVTSGTAPEDRRAALVLRSRAREALADLPAAIADLREAIVGDPGDARLRSGLGLLLADTGDVQGAIDEFSTAVRLDTGYARAWNNLGNVLRASGRGAEAAAAVRRAVTVQPDYALAWSNLGVILQDQGDEGGARDALRRALELRPDPRTMQALAALARQRGDVDEAVDMYARAAQLAPADTQVLLSLAGVLAERDDLAEARRVYASARARTPALLRAAFGEALTLPTVYADTAAVEAARAGYVAGLTRLESEVPAMVRGRSFRDVHDDLRWTNFLLAYQGEDDRDLQARFAALAGRSIAAVAPEWRARPEPRATGARIRVGFASAFFNDGTCGRYFRSWITGLSRARFEIFVYHLRRDLTPFLQELSPHADRIRTFSGLSLVPSDIAPVIRGDGLDALVYPELGMHGTSMALAAVRLAPVQCAAWGHPVTTGHETIDVFLTCAAMEPPGAASHYTERLLALPGIGTCYARPGVPSDASRARFGLPEGVALFLCPQSLFKIHPENDALFARVLAAAPTTRLVVFEGRHPGLTARYRARLGAALGRAGLRVEERLIVLPQCSHDDYMRVNAVCDAMLDTLRWSGGNTSLDALAAGLPIVTLPGRFMRGRQSAGMLTLAGIEGLVAGDEDEYVGIASRLAQDPAWREARAADVRGAAARLFDDPEPVRALAEVLESLVRHGPRDVAEG